MTGLGEVGPRPGCRPALVPEPARGPVLGTALAGLGTGAALALLVGVPALDRADARLDRAVVRATASGRAALRPVADLSGPAVLVACCLALAAACLLLRRPAAAVLAVAGPAAATALSDLVLKPLVARPAAAGGYAYPSGHATAVTAVTTVLVVLALPGGVLAGRTSRRARLLLHAVAGVATGYVALGLVALGYHSTTDVVGGAALGAGTVCALAALLDRATRPLA